MHRSTPQEDFVEKIDKLFATLDKDGSGELDFSELRNGLKAMKFTPAVIIKVATIMPRFICRPDFRVANAQ